MSGVTPEQAKSMGDILRRLNAATDENDFGQPSQNITETYQPEAKKTDTMGSIMSSFSRAITDDSSQSPAFEMVYSPPEPQHDFSPPVTASVVAPPRAPVRQPIAGSTGWEISSQGKRFSVTHAGVTMADNLSLREAAVALREALSEGDTFTSYRVKNILALEEEYNRAMQDAVHYTQRSKVMEGAGRDDAQNHINVAYYRMAKVKASLSNK